MSAPNQIHETSGETSSRNVAGGEEAILEDLRWLGVDWDEGPVRQSERADRHREAARALAGVFDAANVTDNQSGTVKMSPVPCSGWMLDEWI